MEVEEMEEEVKEEKVVEVEEEAEKVEKEEEEVVEEEVEKVEEEDKFRFNDALIHEGRLRKNCILNWFSIEKAKKIRNTITHLGV